MIIIGFRNSSDNNDDDCVCCKTNPKLSEKIEKVEKEKKEEQQINLSNLRRECSGKEILFVFFSTFCLIKLFSIREFLQLML